MPPCDKGRYENYFKPIDNIKIMRVQNSTPFRNQNRDNIKTKHEINQITQKFVLFFVVIRKRTFSENHRHYCQSYKKTAKGIVPKLVIKISEYVQLGIYVKPESK